MNNIKSGKIFISDTLGSVTFEITEPSSYSVFMLLAHGAGADMNHSFMKNLSEALAAEGIATMRFNFIYMEQGKKRPDVPAVAHAVLKNAIDYALARYPNVPFVLSGKSFGGRMASQLLSKEYMQSVRAIIFYGFPLHPAGNPGKERADHLHQIKVPILFLQGTKDQLATLSLMQAVCNDLPHATLNLLEGADHSFKIGKKDCIDLLSKKSKKWLEEKTIYKTSNVMHT